MTSFVPREILRHTVPVPDTVSPQMRNLNAAPLNPTWNTNPRTASEWKERINAGAAAVAGVLPALRKELRVNAEPLTIDGLKAYMATPEDIPSVNRNRLLIHLHGGCYVFFRQVRNRRSDLHGGVRAFQSHFGRLSHAAR